MHSARPAVSFLPLLSLLAFTSACDSDVPPGDAELRALTYDVDLVIELADGGEEDGTILWEIVEADVFDGLAVAGDLVLYLEGDEVFTAAGVQTCQLDAPQLDTTVRELIAASGSEVRLTLWHDLVFAGPVDTRISSRSRMLKAYGDQLVLEIVGDEVYLGERADGVRLIRTGAELEPASDARKLLVAALITGECGATGLASHGF